jgi:hypothetical protein
MNPLSGLSAFYLKHKLSIGFLIVLAVFSTVSNKKEQQVTK